MQKGSVLCTTRARRKSPTPRGGAATCCAGREQRAVSARAGVRPSPAPSVQLAQRYTHRLFQRSWTGWLNATLSSHLQGRPGVSRCEVHDVQIMMMCVPALNRSTRRARPCARKYLVSS